MDTCNSRTRRIVQTSPRPFVLLSTRSLSVYNTRTREALITNRLPDDVVEEAPVANPDNAPPRVAHPGVFTIKAGHDRLHHPIIHKTSAMEHYRWTSLLLFALVLRSAAPFKIPGRKQFILDITVSTCVVPVLRQYAFSDQFSLFFFFYRVVMHWIVFANPHSVCYYVVRYVYKSMRINMTILI